MADTKWWHAEEPAQVADEVMSMGFSELEHHRLADIRYVFVNKEAGKDGCKIMASTRKVPGLMAAQLQSRGLAESAGDVHATPMPIYVIQVWADGWNSLDPKAKRALMHHELAHIAPLDGRLVPHAVEEHLSTVSRFGDWRQSLTLFHQVLNQERSS